MNYEPAISVWEDMKEKLCDEYLLPYYRAKYLPQSQCGTFQVEANMMNPHPHPISCPQCTFAQSIKEFKELSIKLNERCSRHACSCEANEDSNRFNWETKDTRSQ